MYPVAGAGTITKADVTMAAGAGNVSGHISEVPAIPNGVERIVMPGAPTCPTSFDLRAFCYSRTSQECHRCITGDRFLR